MGRVSIVWGGHWSHGRGVYLINLRKLLGEGVINLFSPAEGTPLTPLTTSTLTSQSCAVLGLDFLKIQQYGTNFDVYSANGKGQKVTTFIIE